MSKILLVEPAYRSKFPPLGLLRIASYHKAMKDRVTFVRGKNSNARQKQWDRVYVSSLFTWGLPQTIDTIRYYMGCVDDPSKIIVGGIAATLMPEYIKQRVSCLVVEGPLDTPGKLGPGTPAIAHLPPDYRILNGASHHYSPEDAYFCRITIGCVRKCRFCAVPRLEPVFRRITDWPSQVKEVRRKYSSKQHLVFLDNNILAIGGLEKIVDDICDLGFSRNARRKGRQRCVDFNQGIDARLIDEKTAALLAKIALSPVRLAFDRDATEASYRRAIALLAGHGFNEFTNYILFNYNDTPANLYRRLRINLELSKKHEIRVTGFPMRFVPIHDINRHFVSQGWCWRYLRGLQCILLATHGVVSPKPSFFDGAFGGSCKEFLEILAMPDRYIIYRKENTKAADAWRFLYRKLSHEDRTEFLNVLERMHFSEDRCVEIQKHKAYARLLGHYYLKGQKSSCG